MSTRTETTDVLVIGGGTDSAVGVIVEHGARAVVRDNEARNVTYPLARPKAT